MNQREQFNSSPITPIYSQTEPNEPIEYGSAAIETIGNGGSDKLQTRAMFREKFSHDHRLKITVPEREAASDEGNGIEQFFRKMAQIPAKVMAEKTRFRFVEYGTTFEGFCVHAADDKSVYHPAQPPMQLRLSSSSIAKAVFHLFNWPDISGPESYVLQTGEPPCCGLRVCGRFRMECDGWLPHAFPAP